MATSQAAYEFHLRIYTRPRRVATTSQHCLHMDIDDPGLIQISHSICSSFNLPARNKPSHQLYSCISPDAVFSYSCFDDPRRASVRRIFAIFFHTLPKMVPGSRPSVIHRNLSQASHLAGRLSLPPGIHKRMLLATACTGLAFLGKNISTTLPYLAMQSSRPSFHNEVRHERSGPRMRCSSRLTSEVKFLYPKGKHVSPQSAMLHVCGGDVVQEGLDLV